MGNGLAGKCQRSIVAKMVLIPESQGIWLCHQRCKQLLDAVKQRFIPRYLIGVQQGKDFLSGLSDDYPPSIDEMTTLVLPTKKGFRRVQLATLKEDMIHVRDKDVIVTQKRMLIDKRQDGLAIPGPLLVVEQGTRLQQGTPGFECLVHRVVAAWMGAACFIIRANRAVEALRIQEHHFGLRGVLVKRIV